MFKTITTGSMLFNRHTDTVLFVYYVVKRNVTKKRHSAGFGFRTVLKKNAKI